MPQFVRVDKNGNPVASTRTFVRVDRNGNPIDRSQVSPNADILRRQAAQFPTSAEQGGTPGAMVQPQQLAPTDPRRTAGDVAADQMVAVRRGVPKAITGIPGAIAAGASALGQMVTGGGTSRAQELVRGIVQPAVPVIHTLRGLAPTPEDPQWEQAAEGAGAMLGGTLIEPALRGVNFAAKEAASHITTPEALRARARANRAAKTGGLGGVADDVMAYGLGYMMGGRRGAAALETANIARQAGPIRRLKARGQEAASRWVESSPTSMRRLADAEAELVRRREVDAQMAQERGNPDWWKPETPSEPIPYPQPPEVLPGLQHTMSALRQQAVIDNSLMGLEQKPAAVRGADLPVPESISSPAPTTAAPARAIEAVKRAIAPRGKTAKVDVADTTATLLEEMPELADTSLHGTHNQARFDKALFDGFKQRERAVLDAEANIPPETPVDITPIVDKFKELEQSAVSLADPSLTYAMKSLVKAWESLPKQLPWNQFIKAKRQFFNANNGNSFQVREAYRALMDASSAVSQDLAAANLAYSRVRPAVDAAQLRISGASAGQRISAQGVTPKTTMKSLRSQ